MSKPRKTMKSFRNQLNNDLNDDLDIEDLLDEESEDSEKEPDSWTIITALDRVLNQARGSQLSDNFWENVNMIKYDDYGKLAASYNSLISGIPGSLVAAITGQGALATFGG